MWFSVLTTINYHRIDTNSSSAAFLYGGCHEYGTSSLQQMTSSQGIFHYTQENILYAALYGSCTN